MYKSTFGKNGQVSFSCPKEYYELIGYLAKSDETTSLVWEKNEEQGAWGSEGRILFYTEELPAVGNLIYTAGNGNIYRRVNCNEFVENLYRDHHFVQGKYQDIDSIRSTIPEEYLLYFEKGLNS